MMPTHIVYPRRVLLAVTGLSPQIVTETLYALAVERCWIPTEVRVITTLQGAEEARLRLLSDDPGWFHRLREDYQLPEIAFDTDNIHVIKRPNGEPLRDILTDADNVALADFITELQPTRRQVFMYRSPVDARRWASTRGTRCRCSGVPRINSRMCWFRRRSSR